MGLFTDDLSNDIEVLKHKKKAFFIALIIISLVAVVLAIFSVRYYLIAEQTESKIKSRVNKAVKEETSKKESALTATYEKKIADEAANPWQSYTAADIYGAFSFKFPKNWHSNIIENTGASAANKLIFLADPDWFTYNESEKSFKAFEVKVINKKYTSLLGEYEAIDKKKNLYKISDTSISGISGKRLEWTNEETKKKAVFVILPFRDKTVYIATEKYAEVGPTYEEILKNFILNK